MFDLCPQPLLQLRLCAADFALQSGCIQIAQVWVRHGVASDFEPQSVKLAQLGSAQVARLPHKTGGHVEGCPEVVGLEKRRGCQQIRLAPVVERNPDAPPGRETQCLANTPSLPPAPLQRLKVRPKIALAQNVTNIARLRLAERAP